MSKFYQVLKSGDVANALTLLSNTQDAKLAQEEDSDKWTSLHWAAQHGSVPLAQQLVRLGAKIDAQTVQGFSPLYIAARQEKVDVVKCLLSHGANPNLLDGHQQSALHRACENSLTQVANAMLLFAETNSSPVHVDVNLQDLMGRTALHWAAAKGLTTTTDLLLQKGAKLVKTKGGEDAFHWASRAGHVDVISLLLKFYPQTNVYSKNERDESSIDLAKNQEIKDLLKAHALSCGYSDDGSKSIQNVSEGVTVKRLDQPNASGSTSTNTGAAPGKKLTIKLKPRDNTKQQ